MHEGSNPFTLPQKTERAYFLGEREAQKAKLDRRKYFLEQQQESDHKKFLENLHKRQIGNRVTREGTLKHVKSIGESDSFAFRTTEDGGSGVELLSAIKQSRNSVFAQTVTTPLKEGSRFVTPRRSESVVASQATYLANLEGKESPRD